jgi:hypothetical protein
MLFFWSSLQLLSGNTNTYIGAKQRLELPFVASKIRFVPFSEHPRTVCMRVEIYGCPWQRKYSYSFSIQLSYLPVSSIEATFKGKNALAREEMKTIRRVIIYERVAVIANLRVRTQIKQLPRYFFSSKDKRSSAMKKDEVFFAVRLN